MAAVVVVNKPVAQNNFKESVSLKPGRFLILAGNFQL
jgi:hypothetical protein